MKLTKVLTVGKLFFISLVLLAQSAIAQSGAGPGGTSNGTATNTGANPGTDTGGGRGADNGGGSRAGSVINTVLGGVGGTGTSTAGGTWVGAVSSNGTSIVVTRDWWGTGSGAGALGIGGAYNPRQIMGAACNVMALPEGPFGALVMIVAGLGAIVSAALGAYRMAMSTIVIGCGSWILGPIVNLFFPFFGCG